MNLYLVLALALGAISGTATTAVARPAVTNVVAARNERRAVCGPASAGRIVADRLKPVLTPRLPASFAEVPLTGAATPRAPARIC